MDMISQYLATEYGYETGPYDNYTPEIERKKIMGRIDWNINSKNKLNVRYSQVEGGEPNAPSTITGTALQPMLSELQARTDINALWYQKFKYCQGANFYSLSAELNSKFGKLSDNTFRATYTYQNDSRSLRQQFNFLL